MDTPSSPAGRGLVRLLLIVSGGLFAAGALLYNTWLLHYAVGGARSLFHRPGMSEPVAGRVHSMQLLYLGVGAALFLAAWVVGRVAPLDRWLRRPLVEKIILAFLVLAVPLGWLEIGTRAFAPANEKTTSIFVRDDRLGWKMRANASDNWGGVRVDVNERGFRGPVVPYERTPGTRRVLYLGDSVTLGYRIERWEDTFPFVVGTLLEERDSIPTETVNLAVEGYSQWQEYIVLSDEGYRYRPDLVVIGFVLNDVTEMFHLPRFGGSAGSYQLRHSYASRLDRVLSRSALYYEFQNIVRGVKARRRLGQDVRLGAIQQETLEVGTLMKAPDQANVKMAWDFALADLQKITDGCQSRGIPVLVVVFPFAVQLDDPTGLSAPQRVLNSYTLARGIPRLDLLPLMAEHSRVSGTPASDLFLDPDHLSPEGHRVVARLLSDTIAAMARSR